MGKKLQISKLVRLVEDEDIEKKMETDVSDEKKDEVDAQTVDDDQTFVGETDDDKKDESDEEKKDESEEDDDVKVESLLSMLKVPKDQFEEFGAILKDIVKTEATRIASKAEGKISATLKLENEKKIARLRERLVKYAERSAEKFAESNTEKFEELSELDSYRKFFKNVSEAFVDLKFETDPSMEAKVESLRSEISERNRTIDSQNAKIEQLKLVVEAHKVSRAIETFSEGMTATDKERFVRVVESLEVSDYKDFMKKASNIKKTIFKEGEGDEGYKSFVEGLKEDVRDVAPNLGIRKVDESSKPASLASIAASIITGRR